MTLPCLTYALKEKPLECQVSFLSPTEKEKPIQEKNKKTSTSAFVIFCIFIIVFFVALLVLKYFLFAEMKEKQNVVFPTVDKVKPGSENCHSDFSSLDLGSTNNRITFFTPPSKLRFRIARHGYYYFAIYVQLNCSIAVTQHVSVIKNATAENEVIMNSTFCGSHKDNTFMQRSLPAKAGDEVCLQSTSSFKEYSGNFIKLEWYDN